MIYYWLAFIPVEEGGYAILSPDFGELASQGATLLECMEMGRDGLEVISANYAETGRKLPKPCSREDAQSRIAAELRAIGACAAGEIIYQLVPVPAGDMKPVRISATFPRWTLELIDMKARARGMSRSGFLAAAAQAYGNSDDAP